MNRIREALPYVAFTGRYAITRGFMFNIKRNSVVQFLEAGTTMELLYKYFGAEQNWPQTITALREDTLIIQGASSA